MGAYGGVSASIYELMKSVLEQEVAQYCSTYNMRQAQAENLIKLKMFRELGLSIHRGWARVLIDRTLYLVESAGAEDTWLDPDVEAATHYHDQFPDTRV